MKKFILSFFIGLAIVFAIFGQTENVNKNLLVLSDDVRVVQDKTDKVAAGGGYHIFIRKKPGIESVLLTETTKDPEKKADSYAYRAKEYNSINGDEIRYLNGKILDSKYARNSLVDSTAESDKVFGEAFHIFVPSEIVYGYPWTRNGTVEIGKGTFINIRSFEKKYADYTGDYLDNPFMFDFRKLPKRNPQPKKIEITEKTEPKPEPEINSFPEPEIISEPEIEQKKEPAPEPEPKIEKVEDEIPEPIEPEVIDEKEDDKEEPEEEVVLTDDYNSVAAEKFKEIADFGRGKMIFSKGPETLPDDIMKLIDEITPKDKVDIVFAIDTTGSMKDDMQKLKKVWLPSLREKVKEFKDLRLGLLLYRDYGDSYKFMKLPVKKYDFTEDFDSFAKNLLGVKILGKEGGDIPEAVYEALFASMNYYEWRDDAQRKVILIGDAEPHPKPRGFGKISKELVADMSAEKKIRLDTIIVPDNKSDRGR